MQTKLFRLKLDVNITYREIASDLNESVSNVSHAINHNPESELGITIRNRLLERHKEMLNQKENNYFLTFHGDD